MSTFSAFAPATRLGEREVKGRCLLLAIHGRVHHDDDSPACPPRSLLSRKAARYGSSGRKNSLVAPQTGQDAGGSSPS
jgi:hypothetical protein